MRHFRLDYCPRLALGLLLLACKPAPRADLPSLPALETAALSGARHDPVPQLVRVDPPARGIPFGPWSVPPDLIGDRYTGTVLTGATPYRSLAEIKDRKGTAVIYLARNKSRAQGVISVASTEQFLDTWPDISSYIKDGTVWGIMVSDDITGKNIWGPDAPYFPQIDSIARLVKQRWPAVRTIVRAPATRMRYSWKWVDWAWVQYSNRFGDVSEYRDEQAAVADSMKLCVVFGLNVIDGGDGSSGIKTRRHRAQMTGAEVLEYYRALLPYTPVAFHWEYRPDFENDPEIRAAMDTVRSWADTTPRPGCRYH